VVQVECERFHFCGGAVADGMLPEKLEVLLQDAGHVLKAQNAPKEIKTFVHCNMASHRNSYLVL
jgi:hypothetical protein